MGAGCSSLSGDWEVSVKCSSPLPNWTCPGGGRLSDRSRRNPRLCGGGWRGSRETLQGCSLPPTRRRIQGSSGLRPGAVCSGTESLLVKLRPHPHSTPASCQALQPVLRVSQASWGSREPPASSPPSEGLAILRGKTGQSPTACRRAAAEGGVPKCRGRGCRRTGGVRTTDGHRAGAGG